MTYLHRSQAFIARDIDRLTGHWDVESVRRAIASEATEVGYWRKPRSLPLAVLILNLDKFSLPGHFHPSLSARSQTMLWLVRAAAAMTI